MPVSSHADPCPAAGSPRKPRPLHLFRLMARIRAFETSAEKLFMAGAIPGFIHVSIGQEASAAGVISHLRPSDYLTTTHRGHGHTLAKGAPTDGMMAELFGRESGLCRGRGGSMHIADFSVGMLGANAIVAGGIGIAVGAALGATLRGEDHLAVAFFGDGATARGPFAEAINLAQLWRLPVVFACENNGWASTTRSSEALAGANVSDRAAAIGMTTERIDGNDVFAVSDAAATAVARARHSGGPSLLQLDTFRLRGHYVGDPTSYYDKAELAQWQHRDPLLKARAAILGRSRRDVGEVSEADLDQILAEAEEEIAEAVASAQVAAEPDPADLFDDLYAETVTDLKGQGSVR